MPGIAYLTVSKINDALTTMLTAYAAVYLHPTHYLLPKTTIYPCFLPQYILKRAKDERTMSEG